MSDLMRLARAAAIRARGDQAPAIADLERRRLKVIDELCADPALRYAWDVQDATPAGPAMGQVSVLLGLRDATGAITTGELRVPAEKWPGIALFADHWWQAAEGRPS